MRTYIEKSAQLSEDGKYRFLLRRSWGTPGGPHITFVMLNPSTANADVDDPTIRKCCGFASRQGVEAIEVVNLFALRSTDPDALLAPMPMMDLVGDGNDLAIMTSARRAKTVILAWGAHRATQKMARALFVYGALACAGLDIQCLGKTAEGHPRHPLMLAYSTPLIQCGNLSPK